VKIRPPHFLGNPSHWVYILSHAVVALVGFVLWQSGGLLRQAIGGSLIAAGMAGWVIFVYVLLAQETRNQINVLTTFGLVNVFAARATRIKPEYDVRLLGARERIDVIGFGLRALRQDYFGEFENWRSRAVVRILLLHPDYPRPDCAYGDQRDIEERDDPGKIRSDVLLFVREVASLLKNDPQHRFQVRLYTCLPSISMVRVDNEALWGPYFARAQGRNAPTFVVRRGGKLFEFVTEHFDRIWADDSLSCEVPVEWLDAK
jgi:hypothetical protein